MKQWDFARFVIRWVAFLVMVGVGFGPMPLHAQTSFGAILGTVTDPSQAAIPGVSITVTNNQTGIARHVETDAVGSYRVDSLLPGMYTVRAEHPGFQLDRSYQHPGSGGCDHYRQSHHASGDGNADGGGDGCGASTPNCLRDGRSCGGQ